MNPPRIPEKVVQTQVCHLLRSVGAAVYPIGTTRRRGDYPGTMMAPGLPDVYALLPAAPQGPSPACGLWVECKAAGGRLRPEQVGFRDQCHAAGVAHLTGGVREVLAWLEARGYVRREGVHA